jgi:2,3-bisphosphoglycerate-dependent phosphoglycerate mutase
VTELLIVRHGETDWNAELRFQGHADPPLNETGRAQARELAAELAGTVADAIYSSDLVRARETAEILSERLEVPVTTLSELREIDVGSWQGLTRDEIETAFPGAYRSWRTGETGWTGGETYDQLRARILPALERIADAHPGGSVIVVGHGGTIRTLRAHVAGSTVAEHRRSLPPIANCEVFRLDVVDAAFRARE